MKNNQVFEFLATKCLYSVSNTWLCIHIHVNIFLRFSLNSCLLFENSRVGPLEGFAKHQSRSLALNISGEAWSSAKQRRGKMGECSS